MFMYLFKHLPRGLAAISWRQKTSILCPSRAWMVLSWLGCSRHKALITLPDMKHHLLSPNTVTLTILLHQPPPLLPGRDVARPPRLHSSLGALPAKWDSFPHCLWPTTSMLSLPAPKTFHLLEFPQNPSCSWFPHSCYWAAERNSGDDVKLRHLAHYSFNLASPDVKVILNNSF